MNWIVSQKGYDKKNIEFFGSKFCIGNGYFGYRGTLEEYGKEQLTACTLSEIFDDSGNGWREPVNLQNPLHTTLYYNETPLSVLNCKILDHTQKLDIEKAIHTRKTKLSTDDGKIVEITAQRFAGINKLHLLAMRYTVTAGDNITLVLKTKIDDKIWDINGPHFKKHENFNEDDVIGIFSLTIQNERKVAVSEKTIPLNKDKITSYKTDGSTRIYEIALKKGEEFSIDKITSICKDSDCKDPFETSITECKEFANVSYDTLLTENIEAWKERWKNFDIRIKGDDTAQLALRYSIYLLLISSPFHTDKVSIPSRGLSGQVYKGAMFWDTELYMLHPFLYSIPQVAKNLMMYRVHNLQKALDKAKEYGYRGAFYPWESQETGEDGCTHYNLVDVFTGRRIRTYFRDKQIHISADVVYGLCLYMKVTNDFSILKEGAAEVILECARFFYSYSYFKPEKNRYELLDVTCADEYHERVNNNAYTNYMVKLTLQAAVDIIDIYEKEDPEELKSLLDKLEYNEDVNNIREMNDLLYLPKPNKDGVIEQFDGYFSNEDVSIKELYSRIIKPNEYLGSPVGLAVNTQIIKQADVVLMLTVFKNYFSDEIKKRNFEYYEPRTEHGSSLSTCVYAFLSAMIGKTDWAYKYFMKSAQLDLIGDYKLYLGDLYIGGTHPAANAGSWMVAILGFGGLSISDNTIKLTPHLPKHWESLSFPFKAKGKDFKATITHNKIIIETNKKGISTKFNINEKHCTFNSEGIIKIKYGEDLK